MANVALSLKDRFALVGRALLGTVDVAPDSVGGKLLAGILKPGGEPPERSVADFLVGYAKMPFYRAALSRVSYDVAATEWQVLVQRGANGKAVRNRMVQRASEVHRKALIKELTTTGELEPLASHPLLDLLDNANPMQTGLQARRVTQIHIDAVGESFWLLERGVLEQPVAIWPVPPHWVANTPTPAHPFYRVSFKGWQGTIPASEIIWFADANPLNPYGRGVGVGQSLADELETDEYAAKTTKSLFFNRARPDLIVWPKGEQPLLEPEVRRLEENWNRHNQGFFRAFRPFFLKREVEVKELDTDFRSLQFIQLREFERDALMTAFGVSPEILGVVKPGAARATITVADQIYAKRVQMPRLELLRSVMQERLVPLFDERIILDYISPDVKDQELELDAAKAAPWSMTIDEWRARTGLPPLPDDTGMIHLVPTNLKRQKYDEPEPVPPTPVPFGGGPPAPKPDMPDDEEMPKEAVDARICAEAGDVPSAKAFSKFMTQAADDDPEATRLADSYVSAYRRAQMLAWQALTPDVDALVRAIAANDPDAALDAFGGVTALQEALVSVLREQGMTAFLRGAELALDGFPPTEERKPRPVRLPDVRTAAARWAEHEAAQLIQSVAEDARAAIQRAIAEGLRAGFGAPTVAKLIIDEGLVTLTPRQVEAVAKFRARLIAEGVSELQVQLRVGKYAKAQQRLRALTIAQTEMASAVNHGQQEVWRLSQMRGLLPATQKRVWRVVWDERLESACEDLADVEVGLNEAFPGGVMVPPLHVRCRCSCDLVSK